MPAQLTEAQDRAIAADYAAGMRRDDICAKHGVSRSAVTAAVRRQGGSLRPSGAPQRVSDATRAAIVADRRSGTLPDALAAKYGVGCDVVTRLVDKAILADVSAGVSKNEIRRRYGCGMKRIENVCRRAGRPVTPKGEFKRGTWPSDRDLRKMNAACARMARTMPLIVGGSSLGEIG